MTAINSGHVALGKSRLLEQFKNATKLNALLASYLEEIQTFEDGLQPLIDARSIDTATADRLDGIGQLVNVPRSGREDEPYRLRLRAEIAILNSTGIAYDLINVLQLLVGLPTKDIQFDEYYPKTVYIRPRNWTAPLTEADQAGVIFLLRRAAPAGTEVHYVYSLDETDDNDMFRFSDTADTTEAAATYGTESGTLCGVD